MEERFAWKRGKAKLMKDGFSMQFNIHAPFWPGVNREMKMPMERWMVSLIAVAVIVQLFLLPPASAQTSNWNRVVSEADHEVLRAKKDAMETETIVREERERLLAELKSLKNGVKSKEEKLHTLKQRFEQLRQKEEVMETELQAEQEDIKTLEGAVKGAAKDFDKIIETSLVTPGYPGMQEKVEKLATGDKFPSYQDIQDLVAALFAYMEASGEILKTKSKFIDESGQEGSGDVVRIGDFMAIYRRRGEVGSLRYNHSGNLLMAYPGKLSWSVRRSFKQYIEGTTDHLPLDLSHGAVFKELTVNRGIMEWLKSGGLLVWPILMIGAVAIVLIGERILFLNRIKKASGRIMTKIDKLISEGKLEECKKFCEKYVKVPACRVIKSGLENISTSGDVLENAMQEAILKELPRIERFLPTLSVLAAIAPLLGLLGTVTGMINTFQVITRFGTSDPRMMSGGISEALITTQLGLGVAIPILIMHHFLERKADKIIDEMEEKGTALTVSILKAKEGNAQKPQQWITG